ncbi:MAG: hypothetical protein ACLFVU_08895 [Phycisphaerae bacterium]
MRAFSYLSPLILLLLSMTAGCQPSVNFPAQADASAAEAAGAWRAYDANHDGKTEYFVFTDGGARITRIGYDLTSDGRPDSMIELDSIDANFARHLVIILDGVPYTTAKAFYDNGGLRYCHPPSKVISPYPTMTDMSMEDVLGYIPTQAYEAKYYSRPKNKVVGGWMSYLGGANMPYSDVMEYRTNLFLDVLGYVAPWRVYRKEINDIKEQFDKRDSKELVAYIVSSAGIGTNDGEAGQLKMLQYVDRLVSQVVYETRGLLKVTVLADHGHTHTQAKRVPMESFLKERGWDVSSSLKDPNDVVYIRFGLVTFISFSTHSPAKLAADLTDATGVEIVSYADGQEVVVLSDDGGTARIANRDGRFRYTPSAGDPLKLKPILANLSADAAGTYDADDLLAATADHQYPAPLQRLWRTHFALVGQPGDVVVSLKDEWYSGAQGFSHFVDVASTHGGLNRRNSVTFIMTSAGKLPEVMRSRDVPEALGKLFDRPFPYRR